MRWNGTDCSSDATYDGMYADRKPVYAKAYASMLPTDLHRNRRGFKRMRELTFHRIHTRNHNISKLRQIQILVDYYVGMMMAVSFEQEAKV